jgi:hypothetical protein
MDRRGRRPQRRRRRRLDLVPVNSAVRGGRHLAGSGLAARGKLLTLASGGVETVAMDGLRELGAMVRRLRAEAGLSGAGLALRDTASARQLVALDDITAGKWLEDQNRTPQPALPPRAGLRGGTCG